MQFFRKGLEEVITLPAPHIPDIDEVEEVKRIVAARTASDVKSVMDHDRVPFYAIQKVCDENGLKFHPQEFKDIIYQQTDIINHFKEHFNRARPVEVDPTLNTLPSETNKTRAYPSGHACQELLLLPLLQMLQEWKVYFIVQKKLADIYHLLEDLCIEFLRQQENVVTVEF